MPGRIIDFRMPLPYLLGLGGSGAALLVHMWFSINVLLRDMSELKATVKAGNEQTVKLAGEVAILRYRMDVVEGVHRADKPRQPN